MQPLNHKALRRRSTLQLVRNTDVKVWWTLLASFLRWYQAWHHKLQCCHFSLWGTLMSNSTIWTSFSIFYFCFKCPLLHLALPWFHFFFSPGLPCPRPSFILLNKIIKYEGWQRLAGGEGAGRGEREGSGNQSWWRREGEEKNKENGKYNELV